MSSLLQAPSTIFTTRVASAPTRTRLARASPRHVSAGAAASPRPPTPPSSSSAFATGNVQHRQTAGLPNFPMVLMLNDVLIPEAADSSAGGGDERVSDEGVPQDSSRERVELAAAAAEEEEEKREE